MENLSICLKLPGLVFKLFFSSTGIGSAVNSRKKIRPGLPCTKYYLLPELPEVHFHAAPITNINCVGFVN